MPIIQFDNGLSRIKKQHPLDLKLAPFLSHHEQQVYCYACCAAESIRQHYGSDKVFLIAAIPKVIDIIQVFECITLDIQHDNKETSSINTLVINNKDR